MKSIKLSLAAVVLVSGLYAADSTSEVGVSANMAITSNYVWRGMTQTKNSPAIQGGVDLDYKGFYLGVWGSNIEYGDAKASLEADIYLGYAGELSSFSYDLGIVEYMYPNMSDEYNFAEVYVDLGYDFNVASINAKYSLGIKTNDTDPDDNWEVGASVPLPMEFSVDLTYGDYDTLGAYYLVGVNKSLGKFDFTLAYTANDATDEDNIVATVGTSF